jgi:hypothetical protein
VPALERPSGPDASAAPAPGALAVVDAVALQRAASLLELSREALLLAACTYAYSTHVQRPTVRVGMEQNARASSHYHVDASRMLGNLDYAFPAMLSLEAEAPPQELARHAQAELQEAPLGGLAYDALRAYGSDRALTEALSALPAADFILHLEDEGAPSSRSTLRTLAIFENGPASGTSVTRLRVEARLSAGQAQLLWYGASSDGALLSALAKLTEQTIRTLCAQADSAHATAASELGAARVPSAQRSR